MKHTPAFLLFPHTHTHQLIFYAAHSSSSDFVLENMNHFSFHQNFEKQIVKTICHHLVTRADCFKGAFFFPLYPGASSSPAAVPQPHQPGELCPDQPRGSGQAGNRGDAGGSVRHRRGHADRQRGLPLLLPHGLPVQLHRPHGGEQICVLSMGLKHLQESFC